MNDRHPSGSSLPADSSPDFSYAAYGGGQYEQAAFDTYAQPVAQQGYPAAYDGYSTGTFDSLAVSYGDGDPLFGAMPGTGPAPGTDTGGYATGGYDAQAGYGAPYDNGGQDSGGYDTATMWANSGYSLNPGIPAQQGPEQTGYGHSTGQWDTGQWDTGQWETGQWGVPDAAAGFGHGADPYEAPQHDGYAYDYDATSQGYGTHQFQEPYDQFEQYEAHGTPAGYENLPQDAYASQQHPSYDEYGQQAAEPDATTALPSVDAEMTAQFEGLVGLHDVAAQAEPDPAADHFTGHDADEAEELGPDEEQGPDLGPEPGPASFNAAPHSRRRRAPRPRRSALLTVAVPSVAVMGVAGAAAATVMDDGQESDATTAQAAPDAAAVKPANSKLDTQLAGLSADADDFADRASRTQERIDLKQRQEEERARKAKEAARKEAMRPKFALPVKQHGLSAQFGQAGVNWMSIHTGIDFPVSYGTPVMAATDGTISTKYDMSYGNMAVVTAKDGTETWYCHLSSTKLRSGEVKAGDTIAYSGNSGNSTGPHMHFEVRPGGGAAVDPLPWLRAKGLDPT